MQLCFFCKYSKVAFPQLSAAHLYVNENVSQTLLLKFLFHAAHFPGNVNVKGFHGFHTKIQIIGSNFMPDMMANVYLDFTTAALHSH